MSYSNSHDVTLSFDAGRLLWRHIRNYVGEANSIGANISIWEGEGFFSRPFVISGSLETMMKVKSDLDKWTKEMGND